MDERQRRIGRNEAVFRKVNDNLAELNEAFSPITGTLTIVCECGRTACIEQITIDVEAYGDVRTEDRQFILVPGHAEPDIEIVVASYPTYEVVEKLWLRNCASGR